MRIALTLLVGLSLVPSSAAGQVRLDQRRSVAERLGALQRMPIGPRTALATQLRARARTDCRGAFASPALGCLVEMASAECKKLEPQKREPQQVEDCQLVADVIITNYLAEEFWVPKSARRSLLRDQGSLGAALATQVRAAHARLAARLALSPEANHPLARAIDQFCTEVSGHEALPWNRCAAALLWYVTLPRRGAS